MAAAPPPLVPAWPPVPGAYTYILTLNNEEIAWEGLRRNPDYQRHFRLRGADYVEPNRLPSDQYLWRVPPVSSGSDRWGLRSFR